MTTIKSLTFLFFLTFFYSNSLSGNFSLWTSKEKIKGPVKWQSQLIVDPEEKNLELQVFFSLTDSWHLYWKNPGDIGLAPVVRLYSGEESILFSSWKWPVPQRYESMNLVNFIYENQLLLIGTIDGKIDLDKELRVELEWLVCEDTCIPGSGETILEKSSDSDIKLFQSKFNGVFPVVDTENFVEKIYNESASTSLVFSKQHPLKNAYFFHETFLEEALKQNFEVDRNILKIMAPRSGLGAGVLRIKLKSGEIIGLEIGEALWQKESAQASGDLMSKTSLLTLILMAFGGGIILNLMPCVFPVLGLKIVSFVNLAGESKGKVKWYGIAYSIGIVTSFLILAVGLFALRASGVQVGWGYQLQYPWFVVALALVFLTFALSLWGCFEMGYSLVGLDQKAEKYSNPLVSNFFSGVLTTVAATPCSAPLLGPALGSAVLLEPTMGFLLFFSMGIGLSFPYLLLSFVPSWIQYLPKPGNWMILLKQGLAFPILGAVVFLCWILAGQVEEQSLLWIYLSISLWSMALWVYGKSVLGKGFQKTHALAFILILISLWGFVIGLKEKDETWQLWSQSLEQIEIESGKNVWVDYTARWCNTCQINKRVFTDPYVKRLLKEKEVVLLKADWTNRDPEITKSLERLGQAAIPVNLLFSNKNSGGYLFSEILTVEDVIEQLERLP